MKQYQTVISQFIRYIEFYYVFNEKSYGLFNIIQKLRPSEKKRLQIWNVLKKIHHFKKVIKMGVH